MPTTDNLQNTAKPSEPIHTIMAFRIPTRLLFAVEGWCLRHDTDRSKFIRSCIRERLRALGAEPDPRLEDGLRVPE